MDWRAAIGLALTASLVLLGGAGTGTAETTKTEPAGVKEAFTKFARAVRDNRYDEVVKYIAPPGDKVWVNLAAVQAAAAKYKTALDQKFGQSDGRSFLDQFSKPNLAEKYYEARGTIREVKEAGNGRVHVTVWTRGPRLGGDAERTYERKFTAVKVGGRWKFQLPPPLAGGSPVVNKVKRTAPDGQVVEVYAEHNPKGSPDQKNWEELKPSTSDGMEEELKLTAELLARFAEILPAQTDQVQKGAYRTRQEALDALERAFRELSERALKELKKGGARP